MPRLGLEPMYCRESSLYDLSNWFLDDNFNQVLNRMADDENSRWERRTWPELKRLTEEVPEAGIHFQSMDPRLSPPFIHSDN